MTLPANPQQRNEGLRQTQTEKDLDKSRRFQTLFGRAIDLRVDRCG